eukprot:TRINITY_DN418_c0_g1_i1.p1 TRINITY_DN418_c0_g1~~TRINITY_DN418_c0_g1_i1.p1  ORF type:complete len:305 (-),score=56.61 TRINITY_DN418_c0_g1_i1:48-962(-)
MNVINTGVTDNLRLRQTVVLEEVAPTPFFAHGERKRDTEDLRIYVLRKAYQKRVIQGIKPRHQNLPASEEEAARKARQTKSKKLRRASLSPVNTKEVLLVSRKSRSASNSHGGFKSSPSLGPEEKSEDLLDDEELVLSLNHVENKYGTFPDCAPIAGESPKRLRDEEFVLQNMAEEGIDEDPDFESVSTDMSSASSLGNSSQLSLEDIPGIFLSSSSTLSDEQLPQSSSSSSFDHQHQRGTVNYGPRRKKRNSLAISAPESRLEHQRVHRTSPLREMTGNDKKNKNSIPRRGLALFIRCFGCHS